MNIMVKQVNTKNKLEKRPLSLAPLSFDEAVRDLLKVKPMPKPSKKKTTAKKRASRVGTK